MKKRKHENNINIFIKRFLIKSMICMILFLIFLICNKKIDNFESFIYDNLYTKSFSFAKVNSWYEKYFGNLFPINTVEDVKVFSETLTYKGKKEYKDGVMLEVGDNYLVPSINNGIVVYIGEKPDYGKTVSSLSAAAAGRHPQVLGQARPQYHRRRLFHLCSDGNVHCPFPHCL